MRAPWTVRSRSKNRPMRGGGIVGRDPTMHVPTARIPRPALRALHGCALLACALLCAACGDAPHDPATPQAARTTALERVPHLGRPEAGYVGSDACKACHEDQHESWYHSFHRTITQVATPASVRAPFDGITVDARGARYRLRRDGDAFFVRDLDAHADEGAAEGKARESADAEPRVVMVTGSHHMQVYWLERAGAEREQAIFPFAYLLDQQRWIHRHDGFLSDPASEQLDVLWNETCIRCHATGAEPGRGEDGRYEPRVAELGIACEACHGPGAEHVRHHEIPANANAEAHAIVNPLDLPVVEQAQVCGQCHSLSGPATKELEDRWYVEGDPFRPGANLWDTRLVVRHPAKARTPAPRVPAELGRIPAHQLDQFYWRDGMVRVSGKEYHGLIETACYQRGEMTCLSCHSMHGGKPEDQLAPNRLGDASCIRCHAEIAADLRAHTHHAPASSGSRCLNCHMPHTSYGLRKAMRSHEISSPSVQESLAPVGRPNACNLCHIDQSLAWTAGHLRDWYGHEAPAIPAPFDEHAAVLVWLLRGDAGQRALAAWHMGWPTARATAGEDWLAPHLAIAATSDPYSAVRLIAGRSLKTLPGFDAWEHDFLAPHALQRKAQRAAYARWLKRTRDPALHVPRLGLRADGRMDDGLIGRLQRERDNRSVSLSE